jgi:acyl carrier protein
MTREEFLSSLDELVELPPGTLKGPEKLADLEQWSSVAVIDFIALVDTNNGLKLSPREIANCSTVSDLLTLAKVDASGN